MTTFLIFLFIIIISAVGTVIYNERERNKHTKSIIAKLTEKGYKLHHLAEFQDNIVGIDTGINKLCTVNIKAENIQEYDLTLLRDYEIIRDGVTIFKKSNPIGRAVVGGLLFGGVGAIVGASTSNRKGTDQVKAASLKLFTNNIDNPSITVKIFDTTFKQETKKKTYLNAAQNFIDKLAIVIK